MKFSKIPFLVGIVHKDNEKKIICIGGLLNYKWVISLASCYTDMGLLDPYWDASDSQTNYQGLAYA